MIPNIPKADVHMLKPHSLLESWSVSGAGGVGYWLHHLTKAAQTLFKAKHHLSKDISKYHLQNSSWGGWSQHD